MAPICVLDEQRRALLALKRSGTALYAYNTKTGGVHTEIFGPRTDKTGREWLVLSTPLNTGR